MSWSVVNGDIVYVSTKGEVALSDLMSDDWKSNGSFTSLRIPAIEDLKSLIRGKLERGVDGCISTDELRDVGYLAEVNRRFFHPLGLAMAIHNGEVFVLDGRDNPEGFRFDGDIDYLIQKRDSIDAIIESRTGGRVDGLGYWIQPLIDPDLCIQCRGIGIDLFNEEPEPCLGCEGSGGVV